MKKKILGIFSIILTIVLIATIAPIAVSSPRINSAIGLNTIIGNNSPPDPPSITVPEKVRRGKLFTVEAVTTDPDGDDVYYRDEFMGCTGPWFGPYPSGQKYSYTMVITGSPGTYTLGVQAKDINEAESEWAYTQINVTKTKAITSPFLSFLQQHLYLFPILQTLLQRLGLKN